MLARLAWGLVVMLVLSGCGAPVSPTTSPPPTSPVPSTPATECSVDAGGQGAQAQLATTMGGPLEPVARTLMFLVNDTLAQRTSPATLPADGRPASASWSTANGGNLDYRVESTADETLGGLYWPKETWAYHEPHIWPGLDDAENNRTFAHALATLANLPADSILGRIQVESNESETEYFFTQRFGDLPPIDMARAVVQHVGQTELTKLTLQRPIETTPEAHLLPFGQLNGTAMQAARCWAAIHAPKATSLESRASATHLLNGTLVVTFGFRAPEARGKPSCYDGRILSVQVDAVVGAVRRIRTVRDLDKCLGA